MLDNLNENVQDPLKNQEQTNLENKSEIQNKKTTQTEEKSEVVAEVKEAPVVEKVDLEALDFNELVQELEKKIKNEKINQIKSEVEAIQKVFAGKFSKMLAEKKAAFLAEGGVSIDFHFSSPEKTKFNELISEYKSKRSKHYAELDSQLKENLAKRIEVVDKLKELIDSGDSSTMYKDFKSLQEIWKRIGPVPKTKYNTTWRNYHHHVERFYDLLHLNNDLRELDFKHNLEEKLKLIDRAEILANSDDVVFAFKELQELHKIWKEDIGPVSNEFRETVWDKFSAATKIIHDKKDAFYGIQKEKNEANVLLKQDVINALKEFDLEANKSHSDWQKSIKAFEAKREEFFKIGKVPKNESQQLWDKLKLVTKNFNHAKNAYFKDLESVQQDNLKKKLELVAIAESLKESTDFNEATETMKRIQADWKKIGHVPRKFSDKIWHQFKDACNHYFERIHQINDKGSSEEIQALETKNEFLKQLNAVIGNTNITVDEVKAYIETWKNIGLVPKKEKQIEDDFNKLIDKLFNQLDIEGDELILIKFKMLIDSYLMTGNTRKIDSEVIFIRKKIDEAVKDIQQLETNIGFIANAGEDNPLVLNVRKSIDDQTKGLEIWKQKLAYIRSLEV